MKLVLTELGEGLEESLPRSHILNSPIVSFPGEGLSNIPHTAHIAAHTGQYGDKFWTPEPKTSPCSQGHPFLFKTKVGKTHYANFKGLTIYHMDLQPGAI